MFKSAMRTLTLASLFLSLSCLAESGDIKLVCETTGTSTDAEGVKSAYEETFNLVFNDNSGQFCIDRKCGRDYRFLRNKEIKFTTQSIYSPKHHTLKVTDWSPLQVSMVHRFTTVNIKYHLDREEGTFQYVHNDSYDSWGRNTKGPCTKVTKFKDEKKPKF
jgi:hypothetical protein